LPDIKSSVEYKLIAGHYGDRVAKRSQVPLINHINEGLDVLTAIGSVETTKKAFCLHPLFQADEDLQENYYMAKFVDPHVLLLTMEYRNIANAYLSDKIGTDYPLKLSPILEVNEMLIADKVQNYKDFTTYHRGTHPRSDELTAYFEKWIFALGVDKPMFEKLCKQIDESQSVV
jgi:hypothetical protein